MFFRTLATLPALVGAWQDRGGGLARSVGAWQNQVIDAVALDRPDLLAGRTPRTINMSRLGEALTDDRLDPPVAAMIVWGANPLVSVPDAETDPPRARAHATCSSSCTSSSSPTPPATPI